MTNAAWLTLPPQPFKPCRIRGRVLDGMLNIPVPEIVLNQPRVGALVGQGEATRMAQHVRVRLHGEACELGCRTSLSCISKGVGDFCSRHLSLRTGKLSSAFRLQGVADIFGHPAGDILDSNCG